MRFITAVILATVTIVASAQSVRRIQPRPLPTRSIPAAYNISNVPWNQQINDFDCGAASSQMVLQYYASNDAEFHALNQNDIMNVARTSPNDGTYSTDILRVGRFSALSTPPLNWYPNGAGASSDEEEEAVVRPTESAAGSAYGFRLRPTGVPSFQYSSNSFWLDAVKPILAADYPLIILMNWDATPDRDGHYRVLYGYDDTKQLVYFNG